jgi:hypothetical protein
MLDSIKVSNKVPEEFYGLDSLVADHSDQQ